MRRISVTISGSAASPTSRLRLSYASQSAASTRMPPITTEVRPSITGSSSWWLRKMPTKATARPSSAAVSSNSTVKRLGSLPWWMAASVLRLPVLLRNTRQATLKEYASKDMAAASTM